MRNYNYKKARDMYSADVEHNKVAFNFKIIVR